MNGFVHATTIKLIHEMKVQEALERDTREHLRQEDRPRPSGPDDRNQGFRRTLSNGLYVLARRIEPAEPTTEAGLVAGGRN
jgi:hypothetical protein